MIASKLFPSMRRCVSGSIMQRSMVFANRNMGTMNFGGVRWCTEKAIPSSNMPESFSKTDEKIHIEKDGKFLGGSGIGSSKADMALLFECKVCNTQALKQFTRASYEKGVVLIECPGCKNKHVIADNLGWFMDMGEDNNIEKQMKSSGQELKRMSITPDQYSDLLKGGKIDQNGTMKPSE